ncbi:MAG: class I SAM-dependent methyltransferase [Candidatus Bathyarchaeia archaeon]
MDTRKFKKIWPAIIAALEKEIPFYDKAGEWISLGSAQKTRKYAAEKSHLNPALSVLDVGVGTGLMSAAISRVCKPRTLVTLDFSTAMLRAAAARFSTMSSLEIDRVRGVFEALPFFDDCFDRVYSAFALEDTAEKRLMMSELHRVCKTSGMVMIVNMGKPDNFIIRALTSFYIRKVMPVIAKMLILGRMRGNPWRLLIPVYESLPTNNILLKEAMGVFGNAAVKKFLLGGVVVIIATKQRHL